MFEMKNLDENEIKTLIKLGESKNLEFKDEKILSNPNKFVKALSALSNTEGGIFIIGISDQKQILGINKLIEKYGTFNKIKEHIFDCIKGNSKPPIENVIIEERQFENHKIILIRVVKSKNNHFVDGRIYIRRGNTTDYIRDPQDMTERLLKLSSYEEIKKTMKSKQPDTNKPVIELIYIPTNFDLNLLPLFNHKTKKGEVLRLLINNYIITVGDYKSSQSSLIHYDDFGNFAQIDKNGVLSIRLAKNSVGSLWFGGLLEKFLIWVQKIYDYFHVENSGYFLIKMSNTQGIPLHYSSDGVNEKAISELNKITIEREIQKLSNINIQEFVDDLILELKRCFGIMQF